MNYYVYEQPQQYFEERTAGTKARDDVNEILEQNGFVKLSIPVGRTYAERAGANAMEKTSYHVEAYQDWKKKFLKLKKGDKVLLQYPIINHTVLFSNLLRACRERGITVVLLVHDLDMYRGGPVVDTAKANSRQRIEEMSCLKGAQSVICHNDKMKASLVELGIPENKIVTLEMFDYLIHEQPAGVDEGLKENGLPVVVAGNLDPKKSEYIYHLPQSVPVNLYGINFVGREKDEAAHYFGSYSPDFLPSAMTGSFGLVWDGPSTSTCEGSFGSYLKINNPHKTSLYLASGMPVIIWEEAAAAVFVQRHDCGLTVKSLDDLNGVLAAVSNEDYSRMKQNAIKIGQDLRAGTYTMRAVNRAFELAGGSAKAL